MNIIIPSKKIYSKDYSNIVDNQAKSISITVNDVERETESTIFSREKVSNIPIEVFPHTNLSTEYELTSSLNYTVEETSDQADSSPERYISWCSIKPYYQTVELKVRKKDSNGSTIPNSFSITSTKNATKKTYSILGGKLVFSFVPTVGVTESLGSVTLNELSGIISNESVTNIPLKYQSPVYNNSTYGTTQTVTEPISYENFDEEHYLVRIDILYALGVITMGQALKYDSTSNTEFNIEKGTLEEYQAYSINFELLGNVYTLNTKDDTITLTSGAVDGADIVLQSNNLMQGKYKEAFEENALKTLEAYQNGKENATIRCSIGDYYDTSGGRAISTQSEDKMTFNLYDNVIPMVRNQYGVDSPISLSPDYKPKYFSVLGSKAFFDGAVWQELTLQESGVSDDIISKDGTEGLEYSYNESIELFQLTSYDRTKEPYDTVKIASFVNGFPVSAIGANALSGNSMKKIVIPENIQYIGEKAFAYSTHLTEIYYNAVSISDYYKIGLNVFYASGLSEGTKLFIGKNVRVIPQRLFSDTSNIKNVEIDPEIDLDFIGDRVFENCGITDINIPESVKYIGGSAFESCKQLKNFTIGNSVETIKYYAFKDCEQLESITISENIKRIEIGAFEGCKSVKNIYFNATEMDDLPEEYRIFEDVGRTAKLYIAKNVKRIPNNLFYGTYSSIRTIEFEEYSNCEFIGDYAFRGLDIYKINIPESVKYIGKYALSFCESLYFINTGDGVETIDDYAFEGVQTVLEVVIGKNVKTIGDWVFGNYKEQLEIYYKGKRSEWNEIEISNEGNGAINDDYLYYYSETQPTSSGNYWHYDEYGNIKKW